jgi:uroporphyrinogen-III decarboxylase
MTSRERVLTAFAHREPDRVPVWCGASPEFVAKARRELGLKDDEEVLARFGDDFRRVASRYAGPAHELAEGATCRTIFGVERAGIGYGQPLSHPLASATLDQVEAYPWPNPDWMDVSRIRAEAASHQGRYAILGGEWSPFWHDLIDLLGMENLCLKMYEEPEVVDAILRHMVDFYAEVSRRTFEAASREIDIFFIGNDFGSQTGPLLGVELFERFILPHLKRLIDLGHDYGLRVQLHCCGGFAPLIPALIAAGLDALHAVQPCCQGMDLRTLKAEFGGRIVFNGAIDSQHVLIEGTPDLVRRRVREVLEIMMPGGGYIGGASHDYILEETPVENVVAMFDTIREFGVYRRAGIARQL